MKNSLYFLAAFSVAAALLGVGCSSTKPAETPAIVVPAALTVLEFKTIATKKGVTDSLRNVIVENSKGGKISSPLKITGEARLWYFEAVFPVKLYDAAGRLIAQGQAQAQDGWMTEDWVPFEAQFAFPDQPSGSTGKIVLMNDNPSGLEENSDSFEIPVTF